MRRKRHIKVPNSDLESFFEYSLDVTSRTMYMGSIANEETSEPGTDAAMAEFAIKGLHFLDREDAPIRIIMNNPGGSESHGMAIYDAIRNCQSEVTIEVFGEASSMGSIILQAADHRLLSQNSVVMVHYGTSIVADPELHAREQETWTAESKRFRDFMEKLYLEKIQQAQPKFTMKKVKGMLAYARIFTAQEAVDIGLADAVLVPKRNRR